MYELNGMPRVGSSVYIDKVNSTLDKPRTLTVAHQSSKVGTPTEIRRSTVGLSRMVETGEPGIAAIQEQLKAYIVLSTPVKIANVLYVEHLLEQLAVFLSDAENRSRLIAGDL